jgi:hypothetical protein
MEIPLGMIMVQFDVSLRLRLEVQISIRLSYSKKIFYKMKNFDDLCAHYYHGSKKKETNGKNSKVVIKFKLLKQTSSNKTLFWISANNSLNKVKIAYNYEHRETIDSSQEISKVSTSKPISNAVTNQQNWD